MWAIVVRSGSALKAQVQIGFAVAAGGGLGTMARAAVTEVALHLGLRTSWAVLLVNIVGAFVLGWYATNVRTSSRSSVLVIGFVAAGVLGSFTTFSALSLEVVELFEVGDWLSGFAYVAVSIGAGITAAIAGRMMAWQR